jgi:putative ABC transport system ATP-binding protein
MALTIHLALLSCPEDVEDSYQCKLQSANYERIIMDKKFINLNNINKIYQTGEIQFAALKGVTLDINQSDFLAVMGPSGSGKSTLMNIIGCLDRPTSGKYLFEGVDVSQFDKNKLAYIRNKKIGFVFQNFNLLSRTSAQENVELPLLYSDISSKERKNAAMEALAQVGLEGREHHKTNQLSGGEQQRVTIARAIVNNPAIILADEPTGNLDTKTGIEILNIFKRLNEDKGITIIVVTHDEEISRIAKKRIFLRDGKIIADGKK